MRELILEKMTLEQKLGMLFIGAGGFPLNEQNMEEYKEMIRNRMLGSFWVSKEEPNFSDKIAELKKEADYPILVFTDAENGFAPYNIGRHSALGYVGREDMAYAFGKATAVNARKAGFNVVCDPILDMTDCNVSCGGTMRVLGADKEKVAHLAAAVSRGMHDGGVLNVAKHYPGAGSQIDTHMAEANCMLTESELLDYNLYPYIYLMREGLLDGLMTQHVRYPNIDDVFPASLSARVTGILRRKGFDGFMVTDGLDMKGVVARFGWETSRGLAIAGGNDLALTWCQDSPMKQLASFKEAYDRGVITDERLDDAVRHVLTAQHKTLLLPHDTELTEEEITQVKSINNMSIAAITDSGVSPSISRDGRHLFVIETVNADDLNDTAEGVDAFSIKWYRPAKIAARIRERFPNSDICALTEYPNWMMNCNVLNMAVDHEDVVFVTMYLSGCYLGREAFTARFLSVIEALQLSGKVSAVVHFGNPFLLEELPHVPRIINGCMDCECSLAAVDVLAGLRPAQGSIPFDLKLQ